MYVCTQWYMCGYTCKYVVCICVWVYTHMCVYLSSSEFMCLDACYSDFGLFGKIQTGCMRFGLVAIMDPMHWRLEDRSMGWSGDPYQFAQWRADGDSVPKSRHFMWVFAFVLFPNLQLSIAICVLLVYFMWPCDIFYLYNYLDHFMRHQWLFTLFM